MKFRPWGGLKLIIDWAKGTNKLESLLLAPIIEKIEVRNRFEMVSFQHTYRELNEKVSKIPKEALTLQEGPLVLSETDTRGLTEEVKFLY